MNNNGHVIFESRVQADGGPTNSNIVEFSLPLHVVKKRGEDSEHDIYSLHVWNGTVLRTLCMAEPLDTAMHLVEQMLKDAGTETAATIPAARVE
jgi:hypothetical protein